MTRSDHDGARRGDAVPLLQFKDQLLVEHYCGATRKSYATDLRLFATWCHERRLTLFSVRRAHLELFGRWMEETGRMRSTVARRLSTLASFYKYPRAGAAGRPQPRPQRAPAEGGLRTMLIPARPCGMTGQAIARPPRDVHRDDVLGRRLPVTATDRDSVRW